MTEIAAPGRLSSLTPARRAGAVLLALALAGGSTAYLASRAVADANQVTAGTLAYGLIPGTAGSVAVANENMLTTFAVGGSAASATPIAIKGLPTGTVLVGIDVRPATGTTASPSGSASASPSSALPIPTTLPSMASASPSSTPSDPAASPSTTASSGAVLSRANLVGPAGGPLYAVGRIPTTPATALAPASASSTASQLYRVDPNTGAATAVGGGFGTQLDGNEFGVDVNPVADALRVVSNTGQNLRVNLTTGTATADTNLSFVSDGTTNGSPDVGATAYTNSLVGATSTTQYAIDANTDTLVRFSNSNAGTFSIVGPLGLNVTDVGGMDISADGNTAYAVLRVKGETAMPRVYAIDLSTGTAREQRTLDQTGVTDIAFVSTTGTASGASASASASASTSAGASATPSSTLPVGGAASGGRFTPVTPTRVFDSRTATSGGPVTAGTDRPVQITGMAGVPLTGVSAVVANVTLTSGSTAGDLQVYPFGNQPARRTSNLNYKKSQTVAVGVEVGLSQTGQLSLSVNTGTAQVIVDVFGYYSTAASSSASPSSSTSSSPGGVPTGLPSGIPTGLPTTGASATTSATSTAGASSNPSTSSSGSTGGSGYTALAPLRVLDTRTQGGAIASTADKVVTLAGVNGVPADATAVVVNATVLNVPTSADVQFFPTGNRPAIRTSNVNAVRGQVEANAVTVPVGSNGQVSISVSQNKADVVLDLLGYYSPSSKAGFTPLQPARILDTRTAAQPVVAGSDRSQAIRGQGGVPQTATAAILSVTAVGAKSSTDLQVYPTNARPSQRTSSLNLLPGQAVANLVVATIGSDGSITLSNNATSVQVIVDVLGYLQ